MQLHFKYYQCNGVNRKSKKSCPFSTALENFKSNSGTSSAGSNNAVKMLIIIPAASASVCHPEGAGGYETLSAPHLHWCS